MFYSFISIKLGAFDEAFMKQEDGMEIKMVKVMASAALIFDYFLKSI